MTTPHRQFFLVHDEARRRAAQACQEAPEGYVVTIKPSVRTLMQNAKFHAICGDIAKSGHKWMDKARTQKQWKLLMISGHAIATGEGVELTVGIEGEMVNLRESTATMSKKRSASLIEYTLAYCALHHIPIIERPEYEPA